MLTNLDVREAQFDERWSFVKKKEDPLTPEEEATGRLGDNWSHVVLNAATKFGVSLVCGKRTFPQVFGTPEQLQAALARSPVSRHVNTSFVERNNGTTRHRNSRQTRKTYAFSKDWDCHEDQAFLTLVGYNFCWPVRTLRQPGPDGHWQKRSPAMAQGITDHVWSVLEFVRYQIPLRR